MKPVAVSTQGRQFMITIVVVVALGSWFCGALYLAFGAVLPCDILRNQVSRILLEKSMKEGHNSGRLGTTIQQAIAHGMINTHTPLQCTETLFRLDELRLIMSGR